MPAPLHRPLRVAAFLQLDTEHGRGILRGIAQFFRQRPEVTVLKFNKPETFNAAALRRLELDGIIAKAGTPRDEAALAGLGIPVVNVSGQRAPAHLPTVNTDDMLVGRLALRHLHGRGYRRFAYCGSRTHLASQLRWRGFKAEAAAGGALPVQQHFVPRGDQNEPYPDRLRATLVRWIKSLPKPVALFAFTDRVALELDEACNRSRARVPEDVAILGVGNDLTRLGFAHVELSSIQLNTQHIGLLSAEALFARLRRRPCPRDTLVSPLKIVTRRSTDRFAVDDETVAHALDHIREQVGNIIYVDDIARAVGVSRRTLELKFRRAVGSSVYAEVQRLHFERATELMADPDLTLGEIAYASGFPDAQIFSTAFRRRFREAPSLYRARLLGRGHRLRARPA
jgi:LacI family transcriptional regulator